MSYRPIPPAMRRSIATAYQFLGSDDVADMFGVHTTTVLYIVREFGEPVRVPDKRVWAREWQAG